MNRFRPRASASERCPLPAVMLRPRRRRFRASLIAILLAASAISAAADESPSLFEEYTLTSWTDEDGLFGGWIVGLAQDQRGYLWVGTVSGLLRFDGLRFERFRSAGASPLPQSSIATIFASRDGSVWLGFTGGGGVCRISEGDIVDCERSEGLGPGRVIALTEDVDGTVLVATADGLFRLLKDRWVRADGLSRGPVLAAYRDRSGGLWAVTSESVYRRAPSEETFHAYPTAVARPLGFSEADGRIWTTDPVVGYTTLDGPPPSADVIRSRAGTGVRLLHDRFGNLWVATVGQGLWFVRRGESTPQIIGTHNGLSNDTVRTLFEDRSGDIWVGTTLGLHRFARRRVTPITDLGVVRAVESDSRGGVWVGTMSGLVYISDGVRRRFGTREGLPGADVRALHADRAGRLWVATDAGIAVLRDGILSTVPLDPHEWPVASSATAITVDSHGDLWISTTDHGLFRWRDGRFLPANLPADVSSNVYSVVSDRRGYLWLMLSGGGLAHIDPEGRFQLLRAPDRYHRSDLAAYEADDGAMWFGAGERLTRYKNHSLEAIASDHGMPGEAVRAIVGDSNGHVWIGTSGGILRLDEAQFDGALARPGKRLEYRSYNSSDGLAGSPLRTGFPNAVRSTDGRLWFVTANGLTVVDPDRLSPTRPAPPVHIERVTSGGRTFEPNENIVLAPGTTHLEIAYTALEFFSPRQVEFRYRLEGFDEGWVDVGTRRLVSFTNLPPRDYRFHVIARSSEGIWNDYGATLTFSVEPMFYQTRWFAALCVLAVIGGVIGGWRLRLRQVRHQFALVLTERARMAREIHDTLLQSLAGLELQVSAVAAQVNGQAHVKQQLDRVRRQIQFDVSEARQSIWDLRSPALEARDLATTLEEVGGNVARAGGVGFEFTLTGTAQPIPRKVEEHLLRVGREAVSNAVRHGRPTVIRMALQYGESSVTLHVSDDGCGFDVDETLAQHAGHWGVAAMHERAQAIGGHLTLISRPGAGTHLEMHAPLLTAVHS